MGIKKYKPRTPGRRQSSVCDFDVVTRRKPEKSLVATSKRKVGRNNEGRVTTRHKGGGVKRKYRIIDFQQRKFDIPATVKSIEYDPNRSAYIALIVYADGKKSYILAPADMKVGDKIISSKKGEIKTGNRFVLKNIPAGISIYNIELSPGQGGKFVRAAGTQAQISGKEKGYVHIKMPSGEVRKINNQCTASIGSLSKPEHNLIKIGKAGRNRLKGIRPTVRGKAMFPAAHPHGGGEGGSPIGLKSPKTPWGAKTLGKKTRRRKYTNKMIIRSRKSKK